jgi:hypothetical protein
LPRIELRAQVERESFPNAGVWTRVQQRASVILLAPNRQAVDVVGLYLNPPDKALVLSCDAKSQIQALNRTQPGLPMKRGRAGTTTHNYKRNGTTMLFAALNTLDSTVITMCQAFHRMRSG